MNSLQIDSVRKSYNNKPLLSDIFLKCNEGEVVGVLGRNGCGKSTLFKIIFGKESAEYKFVSINNTVVKGLTNDIAYLPQHSYLPIGFTVRKAIRLMITDRIDKFYDDDFIINMKNYKIKNLSGGELRYLETKLILFSDAKFVLLDEPFSYLAPVLVDRIKDLILKESKLKGIIITDHNYNEVITTSNFVYLLKNGATYKINDKKDLIGHGYLLPDR